MKASPPSCALEPVVNLIVNADDLGISEKVNHDIFELMAEQRVTSATLLANGPAFEGAVRHLRRFPTCSFGCHLNVIEFEPLSALAAPWLTSDGRMSRQLVENSAHKPRFMQAVYEEFSVQVSKLINCGVPVSHLDSHQHVHTLPWLFPVVKAIQRRFGIRAIRSSRNIYEPTERISEGLRMKKVVFNWASRNLYRSRTTDGMTDLQAVLSLRPEQAQHFRWIEIMVHPGAADNLDGAMLKTDWLRRLPFPARLMSYQDLLRS